MAAAVPTTLTTSNESNTAVDPAHRSHGYRLVRNYDDLGKRENGAFSRSVVLRPVLVLGETKGVWWLRLRPGSGGVSGRKQISVDCLL